MWHQNKHWNGCNTIGTVIANFITTSWLRFTPSKQTTRGTDRENSLFEMSNFYWNWYNSSNMLPTQCVHEIRKSASNSLLKMTSCKKLCVTFQINNSVQTCRTGAAALWRLAAAELSPNPEPPTMDIREVIWEIKKWGPKGTQKAKPFTLSSLWTWPSAEPKHWGATLRKWVSPWYQGPKTVFLLLSQDCFSEHALPFSSTPGSCPVWAEKETFGSRRNKAGWTASAKQVFCFLAVEKLLPSPVSVWGFGDSMWTVPERTQRGVFQWSSNSAKSNIKKKSD